MIDLDVVRETVGVCGGYPCVGATRVPVRSLVLAFRQSGGIDDLVEIFPSLTLAQIRDALAWYAEHPMRVDEDIERNDRALHELTALR